MFAAARQHLDGRIELERSSSLFDFALEPGPDKRKLAPDLPGIAPQDPDLVTWSRQHLFEDDFKTARDERAGAAEIQRDFVSRSFGDLLVAADEAALAAEDEIDRGIAGAEGRLRKAELQKETYQVRLDARMREVERSSAVTRGPVTVLGSALLASLSADAFAGGPGLSDPDIERIAVEVSTRYEYDIRKPSCRYPLQ